MLAHAHEVTQYTRNCREGGGWTQLQGPVVPTGVPRALKHFFCKLHHIVLNTALTYLH